MLEHTSHVAGIKHAREETGDDGNASDNIALDIKRPKLESAALREEEDKSEADESSDPSSDEVQDEGESSSSGSDPSLSASTRDSDEESEELEESRRSLEDTETNLLARLQSFLPRIAEANEALLARGEDEVGRGFEIAHTAISEDGKNERGEDGWDEVEGGGEQGGPYIEMNLGLGILEAKVDRGEDADEEAAIWKDPRPVSVSDEVDDESRLTSRGDGFEPDNILRSLSSVGVAKPISQGSDDKGHTNQPPKITEL